jgi:hypothetical protein
MAVETAADRAAFVNSDEFGLAATYTAAGGAPATVNGIFDNPFAALDFAEGVAIQSTNPVLLVATADLPAGAAGGDVDTVAIAGTTYLVREVQPDLTGDFTQLELVEQ